MPRLPRRSLLLASLLAIVTLAGVSACGNNGVAEQSNEHTAAAGVSGEVGAVLIRNATITLGADANTGELDVALFNDGSSPDALTGVASAQAAAFTLPADVTAVDGAYSGSTPSTAVTVASPSTTASSATGQTVGSSAVILPAQGGVYLNQDQTSIAMAGIAGPPLVGQSLSVTFTFAGAGSVTLAVPITDQIGGDTASPLPTVTDANAANGPPTAAPSVTVTVTDGSSTAP